MFIIVFAVTGFLLGREAYLSMISLHVANEGVQLALSIGSAVVGALAGVLLAPLAQSFFEDELNLAEVAIERMSPAEIVGGAIGLLAGLGISLLVKNIAFEFVSFGGRAGHYVSIVIYLIVAIFCAYLGARVGSKAGMRPLSAERTATAAKVVDTSVIVDGRILEIVESGFLEGELIVPRFVLHELQTIADSADTLKRTRGRRGLEVLSRLQELRSLEVGERDYPDLPPGSVDAKLVRLAKERHAALLTNDYNLNRVASVEGVAVLNINELANAVKPVVLPGEELHVHVIREGKEQNQGVGYLEDGTMIVVEQGRRLIGEQTDVVVTSVLQTVAGRMIFARPKQQSTPVR
jgi:uncharacterized protein YacL